jgi:hypothetical protein
MSRLYISISTNFCRADKPDLIVTSDFGTLYFSARVFINSSFALPSTGGDLRCTVRLPSSSSRIFGALELGFTLTLICILITIHNNKNAHRDDEQREDYVSALKLRLYIISKTPKFKSFVNNFLTLAPPKRLLIF